jgi:hypothetical protein
MIVCALSLFFFFERRGYRNNAEFAGIAKCSSLTFINLKNVTMKDAGLAYLATCEKWVTSEIAFCF